MIWTSTKLIVPLDYTIHVVDPDWTIICILFVYETVTWICYVLETTNCKVYVPGMVTCIFCPWGGNIYFILYPWDGNIYILYPWDGNIYILYSWDGNIYILYSWDGNIYILYSWDGNIYILCPGNGNVYILCPWDGNIFYSISNGNAYIYLYAFRTCIVDPFGPAPCTAKSSWHYRVYVL